ncbi:MAG: AAA family ATPase [Candidatus Onthovivens sp.]|nr:AAA family ATPase [Candidatus Onthovivens sp.]
MRVLYILTSVPGSGKSTRSLNFKATHLNTYIISSDEIRKELGGSYQYFEEEDRVRKIFFARANKIAREHRDCSVILDSTCMNDYYRELYLSKCSSFDKKVLVYFNVPFNICRKRNKSRMVEKQVPDAAFNDIIKKFKAPSEETKKLFDEVIEINN